MFGMAIPVSANSKASNFDSKFEETLNQVELLDLKGIDEELGQDLIDSLVAEKLKEINIETKELKANLKNPRMGILEAPRIGVFASATDFQIAMIFRANLRHANEIKSEYDRLRRSNFALAEGYRSGVFAALVRSGGDWDLKVFLGRTTHYFIDGNRRTGGHIGNYHYGYMGTAIGYGSTTLRSAAGLYQIVSGTSDWSFWKHWFDDPVDQTAIFDGINAYNRGIRF